MEASVVPSTFTSNEPPPAGCVLSTPGPSIWREYTPDLVGMLRTWLKPVKRARSCRPSSDSRTGLAALCRDRAGLDVNVDDGTKRHESRRTPLLMGKTPFLLPARALP